jgi:4-hydroxy-tetrahydrodipicolinate synthase
MGTFAFDGINLALMTPFQDNGQIDHGRLETLIEQYLSAGIRSFVLSSGTGMHVYLSKQESMDLVARGCKIINGRAKVIAQTSALMVDEVVERTRHAADCGAQGALVLPPFFEGPTDDDGIVSFYTEVARAGLPVIGYNVPHAVGVEITPALYRRLATIDGFCTVKDSSGDLTAQASLMRTGLPVMNGADPLVPYAMLAGAQGLIWGGANIAPRTCVAVVQKLQAGDWGGARELWRELEAVMSLIWEGDYVQSVYAASALTGHGAGHPRRPLAPLAADKMGRLKEAMGNLAAREA